MIVLENRKPNNTINNVQPKNKRNSETIFLMKLFFKVADKIIKWENDSFWI
jgi:hypothetical protein